MQKLKVSGQSVSKTEWKQTDEQTDRRTDRGDCITSHANVVGNDEICNENVHFVFVILQKITNKTVLL